MPKRDLLPIVGVPADIVTDHGLAFHRAGEKYLRPLAEISRVLPVIVPAGAPAGMERYVARLDGVLLTGALSNVHPQNYGARPGPDTRPHDRARDATSLGLIRHAVGAGVPVFAICRGIQELNVALGGTLIAEVQDQPGMRDHRAPKHDDPDKRYGANHTITITAGGMLHAILGEREIPVNSLHRQAIATLAPGLSVEARAPDGVIEAVSADEAAAFTLGVQWHPEYRARDNAHSRRLFEAFGDAVRARRGPRAAAR